MILKASTRGSPLALSRHLLNEKDNDHIELHSIRGFVSDDLKGAMQEVNAMSLAVKSKQPIFSVSLSPPEHEQVGVDVFEAAVAQILERNGLQDQPHALVFHEKEARRHAHLVVSRIDAEHGRVIPLPFFKQKLFELSKEIYLDQGWDLPRGFIDKRDRDPRNYDLALYQQAKREGQDAGQLKMMAQEAWAVTKGRDQAALAKEMEKRGLYLAKGDRRGHVALTWQGEVYALPRLLGCKTKDVRERLGKPHDLRNVDDTRHYIAATLEPVMGHLMGEADQAKARDMAGLDSQRDTMKAQHQLERQKLDAGQKAREDTEARQRTVSLRKGLAGLWDRLSGHYRQIKAEHERQAYDALQRDRAQRQAIVEAQLAERQNLQRQIVAVRQRHTARVQELHRDLQRLRDPQQQKKTVERSIPAKPSPQREQSKAVEPQPSSARQAWMEQQRQQPETKRSDQSDSRLSRAEWLREQQRRGTSERGRNSDQGYDHDR